MSVLLKQLSSHGNVPIHNLCNCPGVFLPLSYFLPQHFFILQSIVALHISLHFHTVCYVARTFNLLLSDIHHDPSWTGGIVDEAALLRGLEVITLSLSFPLTQSQTLKFHLAPCLQINHVLFHASFPIPQSQSSLWLHVSSAHINNLICIFLPNPFL